MSYVTKIMIEDSAVFISGLLIGILMVTCRMAINLQQIYISPMTKGTKASLIRLVDEKTGEEVVYANPHNFKQSLELFITMYWWNMTGRKEDVLMSSPKRQNKLLTFFITLAIAVLIFTIYAIFINIQHE